MLILLSLNWIVIVTIEHMHGEGHLRWKFILLIWLFSTHIRPCPFIKGIGSILFLKNCLKKIAEKTIDIFSEVIIMRYVQLQHIIFQIVFESINLFEDKIGRPPAVI
jgi:hypothetical protein